MNQKFVEYLGSNRCMDDVNAWFKLCQINRSPYITVEKRTKYADVQWDHISFPPETDNAIDMIGDTFTKGFSAIFNKYANKRSEYTISNRVVEFKNIEIESARSMAAEIHDYIKSNLSHAENKITRTEGEK